MTRFFASALGLALVVTATFSAASCSTFEASDDGSGPDEAGAGDDGTPEGGCSKDLSSDSRNCGRCGNACGANDACEKSACRPGCAGKTIHVSIDTGSDTQDGCSADHPMKTIGAALARAKAIKAVDHTVAVCRGEYSEAGLSLDYPVSLRGGYECSTFKRTADFGYPKFDPATRTTISDASTGPHNTLVVTGAGVTRATVIDGFTIAGATSGTTGSVAVLMSGASPTLRDCVIQGGGTTSANDIGSRGIAIVAGAPEVAASYVFGGSGTTQSAASVDVIGVHVVGGKPFLHDLSIVGSTAPRGRVDAIYADGATATGADAWTNLTATSGSSTLSAAGLQVVGKSVIQIARSAIAGPTITCGNTTSGCSAFGILAGSATVSISSSRIYGGDITGAPAVIHAYYADDTTTTLTNDVLFAGNASGKAQPFVSGITLTRSKSTSIFHNSILLREAVGNVDGVITGLWVTSGSSLVDVVNNLVVANGGAAVATGIRLDVDCTSPPSSLSSVRGNAFVGVAHIFDEYRVCVRASINSIATAETALQALSPAPLVGNNVRLVPDCGSDPAASCRTCATSTACGALVMAPWVAGSPSVNELFVDPGYGIAPATACLVATGGVPPTPIVSVDFKGTKRSPTPTIGAFEASGACTN